MSNKKNLQKLLYKYKFTFIVVGIFSFIINILLLVSPLYMLQIYDRVLSSGSHETLYALTAIAFFLLVVFGVLEVVRSRILINFGSQIDEESKGKVFECLFKYGPEGKSLGSSQGIRDLETVRQFFSGNSLFVFYDAPWVPLFIGLIFIIHPLLGTVSLIGSVVIFLIAIATEFSSRKILKEAANYAVQSSIFAESSLRNSDVLHAMGMIQNVTQRWQEIHNPMVDLQAKANSRVGILVGFSKAVRFSLQVLILGAGAWLVLEQKGTPGGMIAASIIMGRALAPVEQAIGTWRNFVNSRTAFYRLETLLDKYTDVSQTVSLPRPKGYLSVERLFASPPNSKTPVLKGVNFELSPGDSLAIIGPSAAGKTTLARLLVGVWPPLQGHVRLDGADVYQWSATERGPYVGYLPQDVELFSGTVAENIARFGEADSASIISAAKLAGCHELILNLPQGYETRIGEGGGFLSGGQRQRVALARAVFGVPPFIVLDEPDSNLDSIGQMALLETLSRLKQLNSTVVLIAQNTRIIDNMDKVLLLREGQIVAFGPRNDVFEKIAQSTKNEAIHSNGK